MCTLVDPTTALYMAKMIRAEEIRRAGTSRGAQSIRTAKPRSSRFTTPRWARIRHLRWRPYRTQTAGPRG